MLDLNPTGIDSCTVKPTLPAGMDHLTLENVRAFGTVFDIRAERDRWRVLGADGRLLAEGKCGERGEIRF